jgi:hypothetical protein
MSRRTAQRPPLGPPRHLDRRSEVTGGLTALLGLLALVVGLPVLLWTAVGWPLPHVLPSFTEFQSALARNELPDDVLVKTIAVLAWLAWVQFVACVLVELSAALRGRVPSRVPLAGLNQVLARRLVAAVLLLSGAAAGLARPAPAAAAPAAPVVAAAATTAEQPFTVRDPGTAARERAPVVRVTAPRPGRTYVVQGRGPGRPRDTFWRIARDHLGDPMRWRELWALNKGRALPDGRTLDDPDWIYPGCTLLMPADAVGLPPEPGTAKAEAQPAQPEAEPASTAPAPATVVEGVQPGADEAAALTMALPGMLEAERPAALAGAPQPASEQADAPPVVAKGAETAVVAGAPTSATLPGGPDAVGLGGNGARPAEAAEAPAPDPAPGKAARSGATVAAGPAASPELALEQEPLTVPVLATGGLLAAGVVAALGSMRAAQRRRRPRGRGIPLAGPGAIEAELAIRAAQEPEAARYLDLALRAMVAGLRAERRPLPAVLGVELTGGRVDVLLAEAAPPPAGWAAAGTRTRDIGGSRLAGPLGGDWDPVGRSVPDGSGRRWRLPGGVPVAALAAAAEGVEAPLPELVTVGATGEGVLLLNLAQPGLTVVEGDPLPVRRAVETLAVELATSVWARHFELVLAGFPGSGLAVLDHVRAVKGPDELLEEPGWWEEQPAGRRPVLVLCATPPSPGQLAGLTALTDRGVAAVVAPEPDGPALDLHPSAGCALSVTAEQLEVRPLGLRVRPVLLDADQTDAVGELLRVAAAPATGPLDGPPPGLAATIEDNSVSVPVEVRVLGPVELDGAGLPDGPGSERARELITFLALTPEGIEAERLWSTLWPGRPLERDILDAVAGLAADALGAGPDGSPLLIRDEWDRLRLSDAVRLDWSRFWVLTDHAQPGPEGIPVLRGALELIRGRPFAGVPERGYGWAEVGTRALIEGTVVDVAEDLARRCIDAGDPGTAVWAARRGLLVSPADERLYRLVMLAAELERDRAGVDAAMDELLRSLAEEPLPAGDELEDETLALYEELGRSLRPLEV